MNTPENTALPTAACQITSAEVVLPCNELNETLAFFVERLGFRLKAIFPADDPSIAVLTGYGIAIRLERDGTGVPGMLRLECDNLAEGAAELTAPNGTRVILVAADPQLMLPPLVPSFVLNRLDDHANWITGRAGMQYRELIPGRQGGRFIASHIRIPEGGPVPDYVHYHKVRFQMIYCYKGWVRVVYEDQGVPFVLHAGDCVLQPPRIRHRVLESSAQLEVIEIGSPAEHETLADHDIELPNSTLAPDRDFGGQRFVRHEVADAAWAPARIDGFESRDIGIDTATSGIAGVHVLRSLEGGMSEPSQHDGELLFLFILEGGAKLNVESGADEIVASGDSVIIPAGTEYLLTDCSGDLELLEVTMPAAPT